MKKVTIPREHWDAMFAPSSCLTIITSTDSGGRVNAATYGTCTRVSHDPMYVTFALTASPPSDTFANVATTGAFTVNMVPFVDDVIGKALTVALPFAPEVDELAVAGLTALDGLSVRAPRIEECPVHLECEVAWIHEFEHRAIVCGRVVAVSTDADCYDRRGILIVDRARPGHYLGAPYGANFVPAHEPRWFEPVFTGPDAGLVDLSALPFKRNVLTDLDVTVEYGGAARRSGSSDAP